MAVKVSGNRGLSFIGTFDITETEEKAKRTLDLFANLKKQVSAANKSGAVDSSFRKRQVTLQNLLTIAV